MFEEKKIEIINFKLVSHQATVGSLILTEKKLTLLHFILNHKERYVINQIHNPFD